MEEILHQSVGGLSHYLQGLCIPGGAGFLPSTVVLNISGLWWTGSTLQEVCDPPRPPGRYLEDGLPGRTDTWLVSPPFISHGKGHLEGESTYIGDLQKPMVMKHLLNGMIPPSKHCSQRLASHLAYRMHLQQCQIPSAAVLSSSNLMGDVIISCHLKLLPNNHTKPT